MKTSGSQPLSKFPIMTIYISDKFSKRFFLLDIFRWTTPAKLNNSMSSSLLIQNPLISHIIEMLILGSRTLSARLETFWEHLNGKILLKTKPSQNLSNHNITITLITEWPGLKPSSFTQTAILGSLISMTIVQRISQFGSTNGGSLLEVLQKSFPKQQQRDGSFGLRKPETSSLTNVRFNFSEHLMWLGFLDGNTRSTNIFPFLYLCCLSDFTKSNGGRSTTLFSVTQITLHISQRRGRRK